MSQGQAGTWAHGWARLSGADCQAGQGCRELKTVPAVALLELGLEALVGGCGVLGHRHVRGGA